MGSPTRNQQVIRFADCTLDLQTAELCRDGYRIILQDQPFEILSALLEKPGQLVTREELIKRLWPSGTYVDFDQSLNKAVARLREALGDNAARPRIVETLPRKGYRFIATIEVTEPEGLAPAPPDSPSKESIDPPVRFLRPILLITMVGVLLILAGVVTWISGKAAQTSIRAPKNALRRLTFEPGLQTGATWSPDGRFIAYSSNQGGKFDIWLRQVDAGDPIQITHDAGQSWQPDWSPDGKYIAYRSEDGNGGLYVIPVLGGARRKIADFGYYPRWSPDGTQILFLPTSYGGAKSVYTVAADGGQPRKVLEAFFAGHQDLTARSAAWYPDNKRITLFVWDYAAGSPVFWTTPIAGGAEIRTAADQELFKKLGESIPVRFAADTNFSWSPTGDAIYFERTLGGATNLWKMKVNPRTWEGTEVERLTTGAGSNSGVAISSDGKNLAFSGESRKIQIWMASLDSRSGLLTGSGKAVTPPGIEVWVPSLSPDGRILAFSGNREGSQRMWQKALPSGEVTSMFANDGYARGAPNWSPDGRLLAYFRWTLSGGDNSIVIWDDQLREEKIIVSGVDYDLYGWTRDSKQFVISKWNEQTKKAEVWLLPLANPSIPEKITSNPEYWLFQGQFSPDGRWIAFEAVRDVANGRESTIYVVPAQGGEWIRITDSQQWDDKPRWSTDGKIIYFVSARGGFYNVWGRRFDSTTGRATGAPFRLTRFDDPAEMIPTFIPDVGLSVAAERLAVTVSQSSGGIWILDNVSE